MVLQYGAMSLFAIILRFMLFLYCWDCSAKGNTFAKEKKKQDSMKTISIVQVSLQRH